MALKAAILREIRPVGSQTYPRGDWRSSSAVAGTELGRRKPVLKPEGPLLLVGQRTSLKASLLRFFLPIAASAANP